MTGPVPARITGLRCVLGLAAWLAVSGCGSGDGVCRGHDVDGAWRDFTAGRVDEAYAVFAAAVDRCPGYTNAQLGLGYAALRRGDLALAQGMFEAVLSRHPESVDALVGSGMVRWRLDDFDGARSRFLTAVALDAYNPSALSYLDRFPADAVSDRSPLVVPDTIVSPARVAGERFEILGQDGWEPFYVKGVNIGAAVPGHHPSEFPDSATYAAWFRLIGAMDANTVRIYTMHPPHFYQALRDHNLAHPASPLWLLHGVWAELPPADFEYDDGAWRAGFYQDLRSVVDILHGRADLPIRPGRASGSYTADVAPWTLGYILGREWEPHTVALYNQSAPDRSEWSGRYFEVTAGTPMDIWLARALDQIVAYETTTYRAQRPVAYTNWPPTDPLHHPTEPDVMEEVAIRRAFGDTARYAHLVDGNDAVTLDPLVIRSRASFGAGYFAAYHVYPYYPDFMILDPDLNQAVSPYGPSNYWGYLVRLKRHHAGIPVLVAEYGVPTSIGIAHFQPQGWNHGGLSEMEMAETNARMTREIAAAGMAGGVVFAWIDEWFKSTWNTERLEVPRERARLWRNRMNAEEHYGILAAEPAHPATGVDAAARRRSWQSVQPLLTGSDGTVLRAVADEAYLALHVEFGSPGGAPEELLIGFDVLDPAAGEFRWPGAGQGSERLPIGVEFALTATRDSARILAHPPFNPIRIDTIAFLASRPSRDLPAIVTDAPGFFRGRYSADVRQPLEPGVSDAGHYEKLRVLSNRLRFGRDSTEYTAMGYDWGVLPVGPPPDGLWEWHEDAVEVRVPWLLLNVSDPSQRRVLANASAQRDGQPGTAIVPGIRIALGFRTGEQTVTWPAASTPDDVPLFTWPTWDTPAWRARVRPTFWSIRDAWQSIGPAIAAGPGREGTS